MNDINFDFDINRTIRLLKPIYNFNDTYLAELLVINKNYLIENIKDIKIEISHDGYDKYGPKSNLYDMKILHYDNQKLYLSLWHRENWFTGQDDEKYYYHDKTLNLNNLLY